MQIGPIELAYWHMVLIMIGAVCLIWFLQGFLVPITGTWERVDEDVQGKTERITLVQFGPFVRGRRMMKGGFQEFTGLLRGRSVIMNRRDHGQEFIVGQGFPVQIAEVIDGTVTATMRMNLSADHQVLFGTFTPQRIEFTHEPPEITKRVFQEPQFRRYRLVSRNPQETEVVDDDKPGRRKGQKVRRTV